MGLLFIALRRLINCIDRSVTMIYISSMMLELQYEQIKSRGENNNDLLSNRQWERVSIIHCKINVTIEQLRIFYLGLLHTTGVWESCDISKMSAKMQRLIRFSDYCGTVSRSMRIFSYYIIIFLISILFSAPVGIDATPVMSWLDHGYGLTRDSGPVW